MRQGSPERTQIWHHYLQDLAIAINNIRMLMDTEYIIGGYLQKFMDDQDFLLLARYVDQECPFRSAPIHLRRSVFSDDAAAPGAAISLIKQYLYSF